MFSNPFEISKDMSMTGNKNPTAIYAHDILLNANGFSPYHYSCCLATCNLMYKAGSLSLGTEHVLSCNLFLGLFCCHAFYYTQFSPCLTTIFPEGLFERLAIRCLRLKGTVPRDFQLQVFP
jgi:hypothetical protein